MVMPANNACLKVGYWAGRYPGRIGHLYGPGSCKGPYGDWLPYALDNDRFSAWSSGKEWSEENYRKMLAWAAENRQQPLWALVPDVVADRDGTLREWDRWAPALARYGLTLAFAVQDGMTVEDVPSEASVVFVGGSMDWKLSTLGKWCQAFPRVHVGRIARPRLLWTCAAAGAESCDSTGWFRGDKRQLAGLERYLERSSLGVGDGYRSLFE